VERRDVEHLGVLDLDSGVVTDLGPGFAPSWSPDGSRLAYLADTGHRTDLFTMNADGGKVVQLTDDGLQETFPLWAPDGSSILFHARILRPHGH
jgi:Tol biopolymer transport system component